MKNILVLFFLLLTPIALPQNTYIANLVDGDSVATPIKLSDREVPAAIFCDSLTSETIVSFYIWIGDTAGTTISDWYPVTTNGTSTNYTATLASGKFTPLEPRSFYSTVSSYGDMSASQKVWLWPIIRTAQTYDKRIKIRSVRY